LALGIAAVCHGDLAAPQGEMLERFAGVDISDQDLDKLQGQQIHRDMKAGRIVLSELSDQWWNETLP
jgi:hypothetical protein